LRIGVSASAVSLLRVGRWGGPAVALVAERDVAAPFDDGGAGDLWKAIAVAVHQLLAEHAFAGWPVSFIVADDLARLWQVTPPPGVGSLADLEAAAALRFLSLYGETPQAWSVKADWDSRAPFFAAAVPAPLLAALEQVAAAAQLAVVETVPYFIDAWNRWSGALKATAWYGLVHDNLLTIGAVQDRQLRAVRVLPMPMLQLQADDGTDDTANGMAWLVQALAREALLLDLALPAQLQLCGQVPPAWSRPVSAAVADSLQVGVLDLSQRAALAGASAASAAATAITSIISPAVALALCGSRA
jgi:hypothetical protein